MAEWAKLDELWVLLSTAQLGGNLKHKRIQPESKRAVAITKPIETGPTRKRSPSPAKETVHDVDLNLPAWQRCLMVMLWGSWLG